MNTSLFANTLHEDVPNPPTDFLLIQGPAKMALEQIAHLCDLFRRRNFFTTFTETWPLSSFLDFSIYKSEIIKILVSLKEAWKHFYQSLWPWPPTTESPSLNISNLEHCCQSALVVTFVSGLVGLEYIHDGRFLGENPTGLQAQDQFWGVGAWENDFFRS